jgi:hypothetical protein
MVTGRDFYYDDTRGDDKIVKIIQSSRRSLLTSFRNKTQPLRECSNDTKILLLVLTPKNRIVTVLLSSSVQIDIVCKLLIILRSYYGLQASQIFISTMKICSFHLRTTFWTSNLRVICATVDTGVIKRLGTGATSPPIRYLIHSFNHLFFK